MMNTLQTEGQTVLQHGESVWSYSKKLISGDFSNFKLPDWFKDNHRFIVNHLHHPSIIKHYNIYHDCGKPFCLVEDENGRHFPNHAEVSKDTWLSFSDNQVVADLIGLDMVLHTTTVAQIKELQLDTQTAMTLIVTAFAEIHSNADMFGGIDSTSFKIKYKKLEKNARNLFRSHINEEEHLYSYVFVTNDMESRHQAVQGSHAVAEYFNIHPEAKHHSIIYLLVKNEDKLKKVIQELLDKEIEFTIFREPDINNRITSVCTQPLDEETRIQLKRYQLLK